MVTAGVDADLEDQLVLLRLSSANFQYFGVTAEDGSDLRFVAADDTTPLQFYVERYDAVNEIALVWVRVPKLTATGQINVIYMYYGNADAVSAADAGAVFTPAVRAAYDFSNNAGSVLDKTAFNTDPVAATIELTADSLIGGGARFDATAGLLTLPRSPGLNLTTDGFSATFWLRADAPAGVDIVLLQQSIDDAPAVTVGLRDGFVFASLEQPENAIELQAATQPIVPQQWAHVAFTVGRDETLLYVNGEVVARGAAPARVFDGQWQLGDPLGAFVGELDQVVLYASEISAAQTRFAARNEAAFSSVTLAGDDQRNEAAGGHPNYFATTMRNVTADGWVVIVLLAIMGVISIWVMWIKGALLRRVRRQNEAFMKQYRKLGADPLALDRNLPGVDVHAEESVLSFAMEDAASFQPSTLFPLYHAGAIEVKKRLDQRSPAVGAGAAGLTAETIAAVRASIDATLIRQRQKLNNLMVLLTISISGGPFLGLLGTVVGVMITFAAIAESGDVNVNSIAPGIAAALVATVAGLAVAIPALFGYNWLGSRIKEIDANTQVFADEYITRIAEHYA